LEEKKMMDISENVLHLLLSFKRGRAVKDAEYEIIKHYAQVGFVKCGGEPGKTKGVFEIIPTAVLTPLGRRLLEREQTLRRPILGRLHRLINYTA
jgi:hypothetical protein